VRKEGGKVYIDLGLRESVVLFLVCVCVCVCVCKREKRGGKEIMIMWPCRYDMERCARYRIRTGAGGRL